MLTLLTVFAGLTAAGVWVLAIVAHTLNKNLFYLIGELDKAGHFKKNSHA